MTTLLDIGTSVCEELGPLISFAATSTDASSDAARTVVSTSLANDNLTTSSYGGHYLYAVDGAILGAQRQVRKAGLNITSGALLLSQVYASTPQSGVNYRLTTPLPWTTYQGVPGVKELTNRAIRKLWVPRRYAFTGVANQLAYAISAWWLDHPRRVLKLYDTPSVSGGNPIPSWRTWAIRMDGETPYLEVGSAYTTGETFWLSVNAPANSRLKLSGSWAEQTSPRAGLVLDADEVDVDLDIVTPCVLLEAYHYLGTRAETSQEKDRWMALWREQRDLVGRLKLFDLKHAPEPLDGGQNADGPSYWAKSWQPG